MKSSDLTLSFLILVFSSLMISGVSAAIALVAYRADVVDPTWQFTIGATSTTWTVYVNDVHEKRYLPGSGTPPGSEEPTFGSIDLEERIFINFLKE